MEIIDNELEQFGWCNQYIQYLQLRKSGLKKKAQDSLGEFFNDFQLQSKQIRREFIDFIHKKAFSTKDYSTYLPNNLNEDIFKPEIENWIKEEPDNPVPYKWTYD